MVGVPESHAQPGTGDGLSAEVGGAVKKRPARMTGRASYYTAKKPSKMPKPKRLSIRPRMSAFSNTEPRQNLPLGENPVGHLLPRLKSP